LRVLSDRKKGTRQRRQEIPRPDLSKTADQFHVVGQPQGCRGVKTFSKADFSVSTTSELFDRSKPLPTGGTLAQSDGTSWMAMYCLNMLAIALELSIEDDCYEDVASKFWEHFVYISHAMNNLGEDGMSLWMRTMDFITTSWRMHEPGYSIAVESALRWSALDTFSLRSRRSSPTNWRHCPAFKRRMQWFIDNRPDLTGEINCSPDTRNG